MKTSKLFIIASILFLCNIALSQGYFISDKQLVPLYTPDHSPVNDNDTRRYVFFDLSEVNNTNGRLDIVGGVSEYQQYNTPLRRYFDVNGSLYLNSNDSNFNDYTSSFTTQNLVYMDTVSGTNNPIKEMLFAQLRGSVKKDVVVLRDSNICVYRNSSGDINIKLDSILILNVKYLSIGNFNNLDNLEDVIIFHNDTIKIFKSNGDGTLERSYFPVIHFANNIAKIISRQLSLENEPYRNMNGHSGSSDRDEIVFSYEENIYIYTNSNNNSYSYSQTISLPDSVIDFEIADVDNDGWNDLLAIGQNSAATSRYMKVFLNNGSGTISSTAIFSITSNVIRDCKISTGDFNKDGWNDIVMGGRDTIRVFENIKGSNLFSTSNIANTIYESAPTISLPKKILVADLTNLGGLSVLLSGKTQTFYDDPGWINENILRFNPSVLNTVPAPAYVFKSSAYFDGAYHPKLYIYNRGDRDFQKFRIYRKTPASFSIYSLIDSSFTGYIFIDSTRNLNIEGTHAPPNLFYFVIAVDNSYKLSIPSDTISYRDFECPNCSEGESMVLNNNSEPENYSIKNYPNPFNPVTKIYYEIPKEGKVKITVYNSTGQEVKVLVNEFKNIGSYNVEFNGNNFSSGIYFYRIEAGNFIQTKKMLLIK